MNTTAFDFISEADKANAALEQKGGAALRLHYQAVIALREQAAREGVTDKGRLDALSRVFTATRAANSHRMGLESTFDAASALDELRRNPSTGWILTPEEAKPSGALTPEDHAKIAASLSASERLNYARKHGLM